MRKKIVKTFKEILTFYGINYEEITERFMEKNDLYFKLLERFLKDNTLEILNEDLNNANFEQALIELHTLKGIVGNMGFKSFYQKVNEMLLTLKNQSYNLYQENFKSILLEYENIKNLYKSLSNILL